MNWTKCFSNGLNGLNSSDDTQEPKDETDVNKLKEENNKLMQLLSEVDDKYKRSLADGENTRIRMKKQIDETKIYAIQAFSKDLLEVADVLNTAIDTVPLNTITDDNTEQSKVLKNLYSGLQMTEKQLQSVFRRHGLIQMNPIGEKFDPNSHHALFEAVLPDKEPGTVSTVTKIGYKLHDRTIRPAMVGVVKA
ncbi:grpE protein homolog 1, mitochondrial-like isoform X2 [Oppia nitens]|nr:grpE protein homolog 1, mitochondrial-like isoform X2 [Oppia nitens]